MQAIVSDIIVNQALQSGNLQVSQLTQSISSPQTSFAELLNSIRSGDDPAPEKETSTAKSLDDKKPQEVSKADQEKTQNTDRTEEKNQTADLKDSENQIPKAAGKEAKEEESKETSLKEDLDSKPKLLKNQMKQVVEKEGEQKTDPKINENSKDIKNSKKVIDDKNQIEINNQEEKTAELLDNAALVQNSSFANASDSQIKTNPENLKNKDELTLDNENLALTDSKVSNLENQLLPDEKVYALDKDSKILVHDQRTKDSELVKASEKNISKGQVQVQYDSQNNATITMELAQQNASENILSLDNQTAAGNDSTFQAMLSNQIQANAPEFVKAGSLILQDNNKGTINLVLHPDDLGNVKIHLSMDGKTISAHITVNTKEALEVFKDNAQTLREAFAKNGYDTASFDVSYNGNSNGQSNQNFEGRYDGNEYWARNVYNDFLGGDDGYIQDSNEFAENSEYSINIVA